MATGVKINAEPRHQFGKGFARRTRKAGLVPAVIYGHGEEPRHISLPAKEFAAAIRHVGVRRAVISSDCGQLHNPPMVEALRITCQLLLEEDFTVEDVKLLLHHNPAALLYP